VGENDLLAGFFCQPSTSGGGPNLKGILFLKERSLNVVEDKGPLWKTWERTWNVYEETGT
jgi:hypothetical protein